MHDEHTRTVVPAHTLAAEALTLERTLSALVNQAYALTSADIAPMWQTAPLRMPILPLRFSGRESQGTLAKMLLSGQQFNRIQLLLVKRPFSIPRR